MRRGESRRQASTEPVASIPIANSGEARPQPCTEDPGISAPHPGGAHSMPRQRSQNDWVDITGPDRQPGAVNSPNSIQPKLRPPKDHI
jgi:hypothetical protein